MYLLLSYLFQERALHDRSSSLVASGIDEFLVEDWKSGEEWNKWNKTEEWNKWFMIHLQLEFLSNDVISKLLACPCTCMHANAYFSTWAYLCSVSVIYLDAYATGGKYPSD